jgi:hypothetical protein
LPDERHHSTAGGGCPGGPSGGLLVVLALALLNWLRHATPGRTALFDDLLSDLKQLRRHGLLQLRQLDLPALAQSGPRPRPG